MSVSAEAKETKPKEMIIEVKHDIKVFSFLFDIAYERFNPKVILAAYGTYCLNEGLPHIMTTLSFISTEKDLEIAKAGIILKYVVEKWDDVFEVAKKHFEESQKKRPPK
jgi:hypothetical protein